MIPVRSKEGEVQQINSHASIRQTDRRPSSRSTVLGDSVEGIIVDDAKGLSSSLKEWGYSETKLRRGLSRRDEREDSLAPAAVEMPSDLIDVVSPLTKEVLARILERGKAAGLRRAEALSARRAASKETIKAKKRERRPLVEVTAFVGVSTIKIEKPKVVIPRFETAFIVAPNRRRHIGKGKPAIEARAVVETEIEIDHDLDTYPEDEAASLPFEATGATPVCVFNCEVGDAVSSEVAQRLADSGLLGASLVDVDP